MSRLGGRVYLCVQARALGVPTFRPHRFTEQLLGATLFLALWGDSSGRNGAPDVVRGTSNKQNEQVDYLVY